MHGGRRNGGLRRRRIENARWRRMDEEEDEWIRGEDGKWRKNNGEEVQNDGMEFEGI